jgi:PPM family protein phosphatase
MDIRPGNAQWQGTRSEQQDAFGFVGFEAPALSAHGGDLVVLADGMGGMSRGRQAARLACERMMTAYAEKSQDEPVAQALERALTAANQAVYRLALEGEGEGEVGTTLVAAVVRGAELHWVGVGDSRLYRYRAEDDSLTACTTDHNFANQLLFQVAAGALGPVEAAAHPDRQALTSFLGLEVIPEIDRNLHPVHLAPGDRLLLCSDGVHGVLSEADLRLLLRQDAQAAADALIGAVKALDLPDQDNATVAILGIEPDAPADAPPPISDARHAGRRRSWGLIALVLGGLLLVLIGALIGGYLQAVGAQTPAPRARASHAPTESEQDPAHADPNPGPAAPPGTAPTGPSPPRLGPGA